MGEAERCDSCELYNAAVAAQRVAATRIAKSKRATACNAWLNSHGVFAWVDGVTVQIGSPEEAAPFVALTKAARAVTKFGRCSGGVRREHMESHQRVCKLCGNTGVDLIGDMCNPHEY